MPLSNYDPGQELSSINFAGMIGGPLTAAVDAQTQAALATVSFIKSVGFTPDVEDETTGEITPGSPVYVTFKYPKLVAPYVPGGAVEASNLSVATAGTGYSVGDILTLGAGSATVKVTAIGSNGEVTAVALVSAGSGYSAGTETAIGGGGTGAEITITVTAAVSAQFEQMLLEVPILTMVPIPYLRIDYVDIDFHAKITSMEYQDLTSKFSFSGGFSLDSTTTGSASGKLFGKGITASISNTTTVKLNVNSSYQQSTKAGHKIDKTYQLGVRVRASQDEMPGGMEKILGILEDAIVAQPVIE